MWNPTQLVGVIAFATAAIACVRAGVLHQHRVWFAIAALLAIFALELVYEPAVWNPTQLVGVIAFSGAAIACVRAGVLRQHRIWFAIAALLAVFALELVWGLRFHARLLVDSVLQSKGLYSDRQGLQLLLIAGAVLAAVAMLLGALTLTRPDPHARLPTMATVVLLGLFMVETISLHGIDAILYTPIGPFMVIAGLWVAAATVIALAASYAASLRRESTRAGHSASFPSA
jgi:hypothetical protein